MVRFLLADDHEIVRRGMKLLLEQEQGWSVCGETSSGRAAVELAVVHQPEVAILDVFMPELNGIEASRQIHTASPTTEILLYTMYNSEQLSREAACAGARGFVLKTDPATKIVAAIREVLDCRGDESSSPGGRPHRSQRSSTTSAARLTSREREIAQLIAEGKTNWCISTILGISTKTVETHRWNLMHKLGLESVVELVHYAVRNHLVDVSPPPLAEGATRSVRR
jgi:DNA-binding NarL/FixJ family response regulator